MQSRGLQASSCVDLAPFSCADPIRLAAWRMPERPWNQHGLALALCGFRKGHFRECLASWNFTSGPSWPPPNLVCPSFRSRYAERVRCCVTARGCCDVARLRFTSERPFHLSATTSRPDLRCATQFAPKSLAIAGNLTSAMNACCCRHDQRDLDSTVPPSRPDKAYEPRFGASKE